MVETATSVDGLTGYAHRIINCAGLITVEGTGPYTFGYFCGTENRTPLVVNLDQIMHFDATSLSVFRIHTNHPVCVAVYCDAVFINIVQKAILAVTLCMEAETGVWSDQL